ncbi:hypothetical protein OS493_032721 [Desmophyllum pertusum]|uniref:Uncharacterized protein n=1 Tax=Desmophyllum pertusum TaxID=174260 RepID=A0A9W9ZWN0_9CNID|nr:hypothetical protein OS493_032721 [Desmophyllum pertusum]
MGPSTLITVSLGIFICIAGTSLVVADQNDQAKRPAGTGNQSEHDFDSASSGILDKSHHDLTTWRPNVGNAGPPPGKRSAIRSILGARDFIRREKVWKRLNRQSFDED